MNNKKYRAIQIPVEDFEKIKEYCEFYNKKIGKTVGNIAVKNMILPKKLKAIKNEHK